jgi:hypothetical protein
MKKKLLKCWILVVTLCNNFRSEAPTMTFYPFAQVEGNSSAKELLSMRILQRNKQYQYTVQLIP